MIGIYLMGFVILTAGVGSLGMVVAYAVRPTERKLALIRPLSLVGMFACLCSLAVGVAAALTAAFPAGGYSPIFDARLRTLYEALGNSASGHETACSTVTGPAGGRQVQWKYLTNAPVVFPDPNLRTGSGKGNRHCRIGGKRSAPTAR